MSVLGAVAAALSVVLVVLGLTPRSRVAARLNALRRPGPKRLGRLGAVHVIAPATLRASGFSIAIEQLVAAKIALALVGALLAAVAAPLQLSLIRESTDAALGSLARLANRLERARELGSGSISVLEDTREELRSAARERLLQSASEVEGKMTLILTLCYLPALALL